MSETIAYKTLVSIILKQLNMYREEPSLLIPILERRIKKYDGKNFMPTGDPNIVVQTEEGAEAVKELIDELMVLSKYPSLKWSYELHCAANHKANQISYISNGNHADLIEDVEELVSMFAEWNGSLSEHILYGFCHPEEIICELLIDDGNASRDNRKQFFNPNLHEIGIGVQKHDKYQFVVVLVLATKTEKKLMKKRRGNQVLESENEAPMCQGCRLF